MMITRHWRKAAVVAPLLVLSACGGGDGNQAVQQNAAAVAAEMHNQMTQDDDMAGNTMGPEMMGNHHTMDMGNMGSSMPGVASNGMAPMPGMGNDAQPMSKDKPMPMKDDDMDGHM